MGKINKYKNALTFTAKNIAKIVSKIRRHIRGIVVTLTRENKYYPAMYRSYWHERFHTPRGSSEINYYAAVPNRDAGIGHQLANWIAGYWYAQRFGLKFAHIPFSQESWESFLGLGEGEITANDLIEKHGYERVLLPLFQECKPEQVALVRKIVDSYRDRKVVFVAEQDQGYQNQYGVMADLKRKYYMTKARKDDHVIYLKENFNIAIHIRRGDIVIGQKKKNSNLQMRWQAESYFDKVLSTIVENLKTDKPIAIYLFSQGERKDFSGFDKFKNINLCLDMGPMDSFLHMVNADLLITSKSSFSYKPALLNNGIKVCPHNFWHGYPKTNDWILVEEDGCFDVDQLKSFFKN
jgi:hypothetical protein